jgi:hypothetical protein
MRLTLRTLLAYLDDILEPADAKELGAKIAESTVATEMVERIREVMRRRRITSPELTGPGSGPDPNLIAEYLDNTLAPDSVADIERICLESDIHLSEVAACHQILTLVLGEAVEVSPALRERMHALGAVAPAATEQNGHARTNLSAEGPASPATASATPAAAREVPDYLRRRPLWQRLAPAAVALVLLGWLGLVLTDQSFWGSGTRDESTPESGAIAMNDAGLSEAAPERPPEQPATDGVADAADNKATTVAATTNGAESINPPPPPDVPETDAAAAEMPPESVVTVEPAPAEGAAEVTTPDAVSVVEAPPGEVPVEAAAANLPRVMYTSVEGILLQYQPEANDWGVLPRRALVHPNDWIASPDPFSSELAIGSGELKVIVNGGSMVQSIVPGEGATLGLVVDHGRVGLYRPAGADAPPDPQHVDLRIGAHSVRLDLLEPGTLCGIEVILRQPRGEPEEWQPAGIDGGLFVVSGGVMLTTSAGEQLVLSRDNGWLAWPEVGEAWEAGPLLSHPQWLTPEGPELSTVLTTYANQYERLFPSDQPVSLSIPAVVKDRRAQLSKYAVETLALTQNIPQQLRALTAEHDEARQAAIVGLREWLPRSAENGEILHDEIDRAFRDDEVETVYELLWGYDEADFRNADVSQRVVNWLGHDNVAIRQLAIFQIKLGTNRPTDYHPMAPLAQRQAAMSRLQDQIDRTGALLPP